MIATAGTLRTRNEFGERRRRLLPELRPSEEDDETIMLSVGDGETDSSCSPDESLRESDVSHSSGRVSSDSEHSLLPAPVLQGARRTRTCRGERNSRVHARNHTHENEADSESTLSDGIDDEICCIQAMPPSPPETNSKFPSATSVIEFSRTTSDHQVQFGVHP